MSVRTAVASDELADLLALAVSVTESTGRLVASSEHGSVSIKAHVSDWVTDADLAAEDHMREKLRGSGIPILGEEGGGPDVTSSLCWVADPIDGTANFVMGNPLFGVNLALVNHGEVLLACTVLPALGEVYTALATQGAWRNGVPMAALRPWAGRTSPAICDLGDTRVGTALGGSVRRLGAASVEMAWCAAGQYSLVCYSKARPWDVACGALLISECGGAVAARRPGDHVLTGSILAGETTAVARVRELLEA